MPKSKNTQQRSGSSGSSGQGSPRQQNQTASGTRSGTSRAQSRTTTPAGKSSTGESRLAQIRARSGGQPAARQARRRGKQRPWWQGNLPLFGTIAVVAALIIVFVVMSRGGGQSSLPNSQLASPQVVKQLTSISPQTFAAVGTGGAQNPLTPLTGQPALTGKDGKPAVVYIGAEYCPYCAAKRWSMVVALGRFGTFSNLGYTWSADAPEVYPQTATLSFHGSTYTSQYIDFQPVEETTRDSNTILDKPTSEQQHLIDTYDTPQYIGGSTAGGIPFMDFANKYLSVGPGYDPQLLSGLTQAQIAAKLSNPNDPVTLAVVGNANYLTAAICEVTNNQPGNVCTAPTIQQIEQQIKG